MEGKGMPPSPPGKGLERVRELLEQRLFGVPGFAGIAHDEAEGVIYVFLENEEAKKTYQISLRAFGYKSASPGDSRHWVFKQ